MALGAVAAIGQKNIKRLMAYSSIGHMGYALLGLAAGTTLGVQAMLIYLAFYVVTNIGVFACIQAMRRDGEAVETIADLAGLARTRPRMAFALAALILSLAGLPPLAGFFAKFYVFLAAIEAGLYIPAVLGVLASAVAAYYYLRIVKVMYFDEPAKPFDRGWAAAWATILALSSLFTVLFVFLPGPLVIAAASRRQGAVPLSAWPAGYALLELDEIDSTNEEARRRAAAGEAGPLWIIAERQTAGAGGAAGPGNPGRAILFATLLLRPDKPPRQCAQLSFVAALAVADMPARFAPRAALALKWPNDVLAEGARSRASCWNGKQGRRHLPGSPSASASTLPLIPRAPNFPPPRWRRWACAAPAPKDALLDLAAALRNGMRSGGRRASRRSATPGWRGRRGLGTRIRARLAKEEITGRVPGHRRQRRAASGCERRHARDRRRRGVLRISPCCSPSTPATPTSSSPSMTARTIRAQWRAVTKTARTADEYAVCCQPLLALNGLTFADLDAAIIATVVPAALFDLRQLCRRYLKCEPLVVGDPAVDLGIEHPASTGPKRWAPTGWSTRWRRMSATRAR